MARGTLPFAVRFVSNFRALLDRVDDRDRERGSRPRESCRYTGRHPHPHTHARRHTRPRGDPARRGRKVGWPGVDKDIRVCSLSPLTLKLQTKL